MIALPRSRASHAGGAGCVPPTSVGGEEGVDDLQVLAACPEVREELVVLVEDPLQRLVDLAVDLLGGDHVAVVGDADLAGVDLAADDAVDATDASTEDGGELVLEGLVVLAVDRVEASDERVQVVGAQRADTDRVGRGLLRGEVVAVGRRDLEGLGLLLVLLAAAPDGAVGGDEREEAGLDRGLLDDRDDHLVELGVGDRVARGVHLDVGPVDLDVVDAVDRADAVLEGLDERLRLFGLVAVGVDLRVDEVLPGVGHVADSLWNLSANAPHKLRGHTHGCVILCHTRRAIEARGSCLYSSS